MELSREMMKVRQGARGTGHHDGALQRDDEGKAYCNITEVMKSMQALVKVPEVCRRWSRCQIQATMMEALQRDDEGKAYRNITEVMKSMQALVKVPEVQATMMELSRGMKVRLSREMMKVRLTVISLR